MARAKSRLFEIAALWHADEDAENPERSKIIVDPQTILADSDQSAFMMAARLIPDEFTSQLEQVEVVVRPF